jgi:8-oxo-dGTP pyrophosphatase MutT (NUDIX family)
MPVPPIRPTAIAIYVYRKTRSYSPGSNRDRKSTKRPPRKPAYEFLQIRRSAKAGSHHHSWQTVYGGIEPGETAIQGALRELKEETNLTPARMFQVEYLETFYFRPTDSLLLMPVFAVEIPKSDIITLNHEHDAHRWIPENKIPQSFMWRTQREALQYVLDLLHHGSDAMPFLDIKLPFSPKADAE